MRLEHPDTLHLQAAQGWLELGNHLEANEELERITPELRAHPDVLEVRCEIYFQGKQWIGCIEVGNVLVQCRPKKSLGWIHRSFALHELKRTQEAFDLLMPAAQKFPSLWVVPYNLACYCSQLNRLDDCKEWFQKAIAIDEVTVKREAIDDEDLKPLWDNMSGTMWRKG